MSAAPERKRPRIRPVLFMLVYGVLFLVVGATASGLAMVVSADAQNAILASSVNDDAALVRTFVNLAGLTPADLDPDRLPQERASTLGAGLRVLTGSRQLVYAALLTPEGNLLAVSTGDPGGVESTTGEMSSSIEDKSVSAAIVPWPDPATTETAPASMVVREYVPVLLDGQVVAVVELWRDAAPLLDRLEQSRLTVVAVTLIGAAVCAILLFLVFRAAQARLTRQSRQLLESERRDPLTGALNHGSIVEELNGLVRQPIGESGRVGLALIDIDNFGAFNRTHGDRAGDQVLLGLHRTLVDFLPAGALLGRYGADEFLVLSPGRAAVTLRDAVESMRYAVAGLTFQFGDSERLPVSVSAGLCYYPVNGESVTNLLSVLATTLDEARASGGDTIRVADAGVTAPRYASTFDVLQGLVNAIDTKDHYTRRHSEEVAAYAEFLAELLGLDPDMCRAVRNAGLLHDIGKIGIPEAILRKPANLSPEEEEIAHQHVALGDMIVRDLPNVGLLREGVRSHHERWDGKGYLEGKAGEEIPLAARILAVADAFSSMTTTRPYRKAMSVREALGRLDDAAGTQLDARLVKVFVDGIATAPNPPLPGLTAVFRSGALNWEPA
jgi:diguanylate cyclase (GGDEF)-like protein/putative nucleotidyltransferase with HDIG domain